MAITNLTGSASISINTSGTTTVITGVAGRRIKIYGVCVQAAGPVNVTLKSIGSATISLTGPMPQAANTGFQKQSNGTRPLYSLPAGASFSITTDANVQVSGDVQYDMTQA